MMNRLCVAFQKGTFTNIYHDVIMGSTWGRFVHCEILFEGKAYAAYEGISGFMASQERMFPKDKWTVLSLDVLDREKVHGIILHTLGCNIPYNRHDLWQCVLPGGVYVSAELNYNSPETWTKGVFCSQVVLLLLKRMLECDCVRMDRQLMAIYSRSCSPNTLFHVLKSMGWVES